MQKRNGTKKVKFLFFHDHKEPGEICWTFFFRWYFFFLCPFALFSSSCLSLSFSFTHAKPLSSAEGTNLSSRRQKVKEGKKIKAWGRETRGGRWNGHMCASGPTKLSAPRGGFWPREQKRRTLARCLCHCREYMDLRVHVHSDGFRVVASFQHEPLFLGIEITRIYVITTKSFAQESSTVTLINNIRTIVKTSFHEYIINPWVK